MKAVKQGFRMRILRDQGKIQKICVIPAVLMLFAALPAELFSNLRKPSQRTIELTERLVIAESDTKSLHGLKIWIPLPKEDPYQRSKIMAIESRIPHVMTQDPDFGNPMLYFESKNDLNHDVVIEIKHRIVRKEQLVLERSSEPNPNHVKPASPAAYLSPRGLESGDPQDRVGTLGRHQRSSAKSPGHLSVRLGPHAI